MDVDIETDRLLLRRWRDEDRGPWAALNADPEVMRWFPTPLTRGESDASIDRSEAHFDEHGFGLWAVERRDVHGCIGFVGLNTVPDVLPCAPAIEIGWRLAADTWERGYATEAARAVVAHAFGELGLDELVSFTVPANVPSRRVMEKLGMTHDPADDFEHPCVPEGHALRPHVLYRLRRD